MRRVKRCLAKDVDNDSESNFVRLNRDFRQSQFGVVAVGRTSIKTIVVGSHIAARRPGLRLTGASFAQPTDVGNIFPGLHRPD